MARVSSSRTNDAGLRQLGYVRDFTHASKTFVSDGGYTNAPKFGFHFHVNIRFNSRVANNPAVRNPALLSVLTKSIDLPKFNMDTETLNKYNKKEVIQKKITYEPVTMVMHDDRAGTVRDFWLAYNQYYYADSNQTQDAYISEDTYSDIRISSRYGLDTNNGRQNAQKQRFITAVEIYSFGDHRAFKYTLINPLISSFDFSTHDYSDGAKVMEANVRFEYENVKYAEIATDNVPGFGRKNSQYYDTRYSDLKPGIVIPSQTAKPYQFTEQESITKTTEIPLATFEQAYVPIVRLTAEQQAIININAANSLNRNKRFSFPTAKAITNASELVDINASLRPRQGIVNRSASVTSNGVNVAATIQSSNGSTTINQTNYTNLVINPKIPAGLNANEREAFLESYPPLPSTDLRTRSAPYV